MDIKTETSRGERIESIEDQFLRALDGEREGVAENAQGTADRTSQALGRLVNLLAERGQLNAADVLTISGAYSSIEPELINE